MSPRDHWKVDGVSLVTLTLREALSPTLREMLRGWREMTGGVWAEAVGRSAQAKVAARSKAGRWGCGLGGAGG